jgi:AraC-like DNA-binding protein
MHDAPTIAWTVDELGRRVGLSRSALHERFAELIGQPPMQYLANWRVQLGAALLRNTTDTVASVAQQVGYESEATFARAFKRLVGKPPAQWRRQARRAQPEAVIPEDGHDDERRDGSPHTPDAGMDGSKSATGEK